MKKFRNNSFPQINQLRNFTFEINCWKKLKAIFKDFSVAIRLQFWKFSCEEIRTMRVAVPAFVEWWFVLIARHPYLVSDDQWGICILLPDRFSSHDQVHMWDHKRLACIELPRRRNEHQLPDSRIWSASVRRIHFSYGNADKRDTHLAVFQYDFIDRFVQHVRATVNSAKSRESLRKFTQTVQWIEIWWFSIPR